MITWDQFIYFAIAAVLLWAIGAFAAWKNKAGLAFTATILGLLVFFSFIVSMWICSGIYMFVFINGGK